MISSAFLSYPLKIITSELTKVRRMALPGLSLGYPGTPFFPQHFFLVVLYLRPMFKMCLDKLQFCFMLAYPEIHFCGEAKDWFYLREVFGKNCQVAGSGRMKLYLHPHPHTSTDGMTKVGINETLRIYPSEQGRKPRGDLRDNNKRASHIVGLCRL